METFILLSKIYLVIGFLVFSMAFLLIQVDRVEHRVLHRKYNHWDHFWLCLALGLTWPYGIIFLFFRGSNGGPTNPGV